MASMAINHIHLLSKSILPSSSPSQSYIPKPNPITNFHLQANHSRLSASNSSLLHLPQPEPSSNPGINFLHPVDSWIEHSISDIVTNLKWAPLLVQIHSDGTGVKIQTEKAVPETWQATRDQWMKGELKQPEGVVYVKELSGNDGGDGESKAWGLVVQRKGAERWPDCYLLKTDRVFGGLGFCTYFCLMRVNSFSDTAFQQFQDSWLLP